VEIFIFLQIIMIFFKQLIMVKRAKVNKNISFVFLEEFGYFNHIILEKAIDLKCSQRGNSVSSKSERDFFGNRQLFSFFENTVKVNIKNSAITFLNHNIIIVPISQAYIMAKH
jgi:hypothetical protein